MDKEEEEQARDIGLAKSGVVIVAVFFVTHIFMVYLNVSENITVVYYGTIGPDTEDLIVLGIS